MKILLAHKYLFRGGGTATYLFELLDELRQRGHEVIPFTVAYDQTVTKDYQEYYVSPVAGADQTHLGHISKTPLAMLRLLGRAVYSTEAYRKALALVDATRPDVAYVNNIYNYMSPSVLRALKRRGVPIVMRVADTNMICPAMTLRRDGDDCRLCVRGAYWHGIVHHCHKGSMASSAARVCAMYAHRWLHLYDAVDRFVTPSSGLCDLLIEGGLPATKVQTLRSFYRPGKAEVAATTPAGGQTATAESLPYVLYFGRMDRFKGLETLIRAFAQCNFGDTRLLLVGADVDGERERLRGVVAQTGARHVEFHPNMGRADLDPLIAGCLFTVIPSEVIDNCPMCVLESFAMGKPVIGSNKGGIPEQITPEVGFLFPPGNVGELAMRLRTLVDDKALRARMGEAAHARVTTVYSPDAHCRALLGLMEELVDRQASGSLPRQKNEAREQSTAHVS